MNIISWKFALFILIALAVYYPLPRRAQNIWLLVCSYGFAAFFGWNVVLFLFASTLFNFLVARVLPENQPNRKVWLWLGIGLNVFTLFVFRLLDSRYGIPLLSSLGLIQITPDNIIETIYLPLGLSFYTLQAISYLVDVFQKRMPVCGDIIDFSLYMSYFPRLISGPIERARLFLPQLARPRVVDNSAIADSLTLILVGLVRKIVIADSLFRLLPKDFFLDTNLSPPTRWISLLGFAFYLYNDFAGYTGIVRGISGLLGIELSPNFIQPYFSRNFSEFWAHWHITLSSWLRDYIFFPLSRTLLRLNKNQHNLINIALPPVITMLASGLWHGFSPSMLLWGALYGFFMVVERLILMRFPALRPQELPRWLQIPANLFVFILIMLAWVPFGSTAFKRIFTFWLGLFSPTGWSLPGLSAIWILLSIGLCLGIDFIQFKSRSETVFVLYPRWAQVLLLFLTINLVVLVSFYSNFPPVKEFIYGGF